MVDQPSRWRSWGYGALSLIWLVAFVEAAVRHMTADTHDPGRFAAMASCLALFSIFSDKASGRRT